MCYVWQSFQQQLGFLFIVKEEGFSVQVLIKAEKMQASADGLVTYVAGLPFLCQPAGMTGTVIIQSALPQPAITTIQIESQEA